MSATPGRFTISGSIRYESWILVPRSVHWNEGQIGGDADAVAQVIEKVGERVVCVVCGPEITGSLAEPEAAAWTILSVLWPPHTMSGDFPELPTFSVPPGAVA